MFTRSLASLWSRLFPRPAAKRRPPRPTPPPHTLPIRTRQELEIAWLLRYLPFQMQHVLRADLLRLLRHCQPVEKLPVEAYTWPGIPGVRRPRYLSGVLAAQPLAGIEERLEEEIKVSLSVLCAPEGLLARPQRNAIVAMEGVRLRQVQQALGRYLSAEGVQALFRQKLGATR